MTKFSNKNGYDLEERTARFAEEIIGLARKVPKDTINSPILSQLIKSATSIGVNYCEANDASSKRDFRNKIYICKKEANETKYWLRLSAKIAPSFKKEARKLWKETQELNLIFQKIVSSLDRKK